MSTMIDQYIGKYYRHYKGGLYQYIRVGRLEWEPKTHAVVYQSVEDGSVWIRPASEFHGVVMTDDGAVKRFTLEKSPGEKQEREEWISIWARLGLF